MRLTHKHNTTLLLFLLVMDGDQNPFAGFYSRAGAAKVAEPIMRRLLCDAYAEALRPPTVWNYDWSIVLCPRMTEEQTNWYDFRNPQTGAIQQTERFLAHTSKLRQLWEAQLCWRFPNLDREKLCNALNASQTLFIQESQTIALSMLLQDVIPQHVNRFTCGSLTVGEGIHWML